MGKLNKNQFPKSVQHLVDKTKSELIMIIHQINKENTEKENNYLSKVRELNIANEKYSSLEKTLSEYIKSNSEKDEEISNLKSKITSLEFENNLNIELLDSNKVEFKIYKGIIAILGIIIGLMIFF